MIGGGRPAAKWRPGSEAISLKRRKAAGEGSTRKGVPERSRVSSPRLGLRELALPWVLFSMIDKRVRGKVPAVSRGVVDVC
jgi:hypothetical protein